MGKNGEMSDKNSRLTSKKPRTEFTMRTSTLMTFLMSSMMLLTNTKPLMDPSGTRLMKLLSREHSPLSKLNLLVEEPNPSGDPLRAKHSIRRWLTLRWPSRRTLRSLTSTLLMMIKISVSKAGEKEISKEMDDVEDTWKSIQGSKVVRNAGASLKRWSNTQ